MLAIMYRFKTFCEDHGINLLTDDIKFLQNKINCLHTGLHESVLRGYYKEWCIGMHETEIASQRQNLGRRRANEWLLDKVK